MTSRLTRLAIRIDCVNAAFEDSPHDELARILRAIADHIEDRSEPPSAPYDINGNRCGSIIAAYEED